MAFAVLVWLGDQPANPHDQAALEAWSRGRGLALRAPPVEAPPADDSALVAGCEHALEQARDELTAGDAPQAQRTLRALEQTLRDHSELWQAGWLLADSLRLGARVARALGADPTPLAERADAIEGAGVRTLAYGEDPRPREHPAASIVVDLRLRGFARARSYWDGVRVDGSLVTAPGEHHLVVVRNGPEGRVAWSGFLSVLRSGPIDLWVAPSPPCSSADLAGIEWSGLRPTSPTDVLCPSWIAARRGRESQTWEVARCSYARCDPPLTIGNVVAGRSPPEPAARSVHEASPPAHPWRAWVIGVAALAITTSVALWAAGAFEQRTPAPRVVVDTSGL